MQFENADKVRPVFAPPRDTVTAQQIATLINAARGLVGCLHHPDETPIGGPTDGGIQLAVEASVNRICSRIDELVADDSRWSMKDQETLEKDMSFMLKNQGQAAIAHRRALEATQLPQFKVRPLLVKLTSEAWVAYLGDIEDRDDCIVAIGTYPQEAFNNFDKVYLGMSSERTHQDLLDEILKRLKRTRGTVKNEVKMDTNGGQLPGSAKGQGIQQPGDSGPAADHSQGS